MDIGEAYRHFGIDNRTIDDTIIESAYKVAMQDNPEQSEVYTRAFKAILAERKGSQQQRVAEASQTLPDLGRPDWPVGLENIGNTCYLNSLLQFLFTIPKLRDLVLNFEVVRMELTAENIARKRVGSRQITLSEIQRAQRFVLKLKDLFEQMIKSPYRYVEPEQELTRLTLTTSTAAENIRRRSTIGGPRPLGTVNGLAVQGPWGPPPTKANDESNDEVMLSPLGANGAAGQQGLSLLTKEPLDSSESAPLLESPDIEMIVSGDNSSEITLVSTPSVDGSIQADEASQLRPKRAFSNKENLSPQDPYGQPGSSGIVEDSSAPLAKSSPSRLNAQAATKPVHQEERANSIANTIPAEELSGPPAIPPRHQPSTQRNHSLEEYARQQDVTEVLNHVLFQLSCAIKPLGFDEEGEQIDQIKDLFYGQTKQHIMSEDSDQARKDRFCSIIVRLFALPYDIYAALDGYFDVEEIASKKRFLSISRLPPIFQIQIDRAGLDQKKNNHHVELKETIYLDRYLEEDTNPALIERRQEAWLWKKELADLESRELELMGDEVGLPTTLQLAELLIRTVSPRSANDLP
jgi:ubiquitin carboxyl-terminal hydrolase 25